jgi:hypothetical protein
VVVLTNFDVFDAAGRKFKAVDRTFVATVNDGQLNIDFIQRKGSPKVNAIAVEAGIPAAPTATQTPAGTPTDTATPTQTGTPTETRTITPTPSATPTPTQTGTATQTSTPGPTNTPTATPTQTGTATQTSTPGPTNTPTATPTITNTPSTPAYQKAVNVGGAPYTDGDGLVWQADQQFTTGGWGYVNPAPPTQSSLTYAYTHAIDGTVDDVLYQAERFSLAAYRFTVPNATYSVVLKFAEIYPYTSVGKRVFDVSIEGTTRIANLDIMAAVGLWRALDYTFTLPVTDGVLDISFAPRAGYPKINAILVAAVAP